MKYVEEFKTYFANFPIFTTRDARIFLTNGGASEDYVNVFIRNMLAQKRIYRVSKGNYSMKEDITTVGFIFKPFYYGLGEALTIHELWDQQTNPVIITTRRVRSGRRTIFGRNVIVKRISAPMFFGYKTAKYGDFIVPVSDLEKTLLDMIYYNFKVDPRTTSKILRKIDRKKFKKYLNMAKKHMNASMLENKLLRKL